MTNSGLDILRVIRSLIPLESQRGIIRPETMTRVLWVLSAVQGGDTDKQRGVMLVCVHGSPLASELPNGACFFLPLPRY